MKASVRLEPLVRIMRNIMATNSWAYSLLVSGGAYYFVIQKDDITVHYRVSEFTGITNLVYKLDLPPDFINFLSTIGLKFSKTLVLDINILDKDEFEITVDGVDVKFNGEYDLESNLPESYLTSLVGELHGFSKIIELCKQYTLATIAVEPANYGSSNVFGLEKELTHLHITDVDSLINEWLILGKIRSLYSSLSKFAYPTDHLRWYEIENRLVLYLKSSVKLLTKDVVEVSIFYAFTKESFDEDELWDIVSVFESFNSLPDRGLTVDKINAQARFIESKNLQDMDLVKFSGSKKITVKDFNKYLLNQASKLTKVAVSDNLVMVETPFVDTVFTLYEEVRSSQL